MVSQGWPRRLITSTVQILMAFWHRTPSRGRAQDSGKQNPCQERAGRIYLRGAVRHLEGWVGFEPTTPGSKVRDPSAELAAQGRQGAPAGVRDGVAVDQAGPDDLPQKQKTALRRPSRCLRCNV